MKVECRDAQELCSRSCVRIELLKDVPVSTKEQQYNPSFEVGESIEILSKNGIVHPEIPNIFKGYTLFKHQVEALKKGVAGSHFIVMPGIIRTLATKLTNA